MCTACALAVLMPDRSRSFEAIKRGIRQLTLAAIASAIKEISSGTQSGRRKRVFLSEVTEK